MRNSLKTRGRLREGRERDGDLEGDAAEHVHDDLAECVVDGLFGLREADKQERAQRGDFPSRVDPRHVVGKHDVIHGRKEGEHEREEPGTAILLVSMMALEVLHVAERIHADTGTDGSDDERP